MNNSSIEVHQYFYENNGPVKNVPDQKQHRHNRSRIYTRRTTEYCRRTLAQKTSLQKYFYYYNQRHQLTDVVHFNTKANQLLLILF